MLNRSALIVTAKQPFLDWLRGLPDPVSADTTLDSLNDKQDGHVYLLPEWDDHEQRDRLLREGYDVIFENELAGWWTDEAAWPKKRTFKVFNEWFDVQWHSLLVDLVDGPLVDDEV